ncbi:MAG: hypothetical protein ACRDNW_26695, partial [Trebonia sp.]
LTERETANVIPAYFYFDGAVLESTGGGCKKLFSNHQAVFRGISGTSTAGAVSPDWFLETDGQCSMYFNGSGANLDIHWTS